MGFRRSEAEVREIGRLFHQGYGEERIAVLTGIPFNTVRNILRGESAYARKLLGGRLLQGRRKQEELVPWKNQYAKAKKAVDDGQDPEPFQDILRATDLLIMTLAESEGE